MDVNSFVKTIEDSLRVKTFQSSIGSHSLVVSFPRFWIRMFTSYSKMATSGGIPPKFKSMFVIFTEINMNVKGMPISQVVIVKANSSAGEKVPHGVPHILKGPEFIGTARLMQIVGRHRWIYTSSYKCMKLDQNVWKLFMNILGEF